MMSHCEFQQTWECPNVLLAVAHMTSLLVWLYSLPVAFLSKHSTFLASLTSLLQLKLHPQFHDSPSRVFSPGILTLPHIAWPPRFSFEIWVEAPPDPTTLILHACKTRVLWLASPDASSSSSQTPLYPAAGALSNWVAGWTKALP
jgi:hypothetical protein